jgi:hypothetical protein
MEKIDLYKQSTVKFIFNEFIVFLSQVSVFFMVTVFCSGQLQPDTFLKEFSYSTGD